MKQVVIRGPHEVAVIDEQAPEAGPGEVLLQVKAIGICGSDLHVFEGKHPFVTYPVLPGHEVSGEIIAVGYGVDATLIGRKAVIEPSLPGSGRPRFEPGRYNIASELRVMGFQAPGAMAEYFAAPVDRIHLTPDTFSHDQGAAVEPAAVAVHGVRLAGSVAGMRVGVIGAGTIGLLTAQVARAYAAESVTVADLDPTRRAIAAGLGLDTAESLIESDFDVVFECVGVEATIRAAILACRKGATVIVIGVFGQDASIPVGLIQDRELKLIGSLMYIGDDYREAIRLMATGALQTDVLITDRFPLAQAVEAMARALQRGPVLKVLLEP
jgi:L-iditol 2-dehydrogenase